MPKKGYKQTEEHRAKVGTTGKPVICVNDGRWFKSRLVASRQTGIEYQALGYHLRHKTKSLKGTELTFCYADEVGK